MGAAMGAAFRPLEILGSKAFELAANIKSGAEGQVVRYLDDLFKGDKSAVNTTLQQLKGLVAGERPTSGLAAVSGQNKIPALKALEEQARSRNPQMFVGVDDTNAAARLRPTEVISAPGRRPQAGIGVRTPRTTAQSQRDTIVGKLYNEADKGVVDADPLLMDLLGGDLVRPLVGKADTVLDQQITNQLTKGMRPTIEGIRGGKYTSEYSLPEWSMTPTMPAKIDYPKVSIGAVHGVRKQLDKKIASMSKGQLTPADQEALQALQDNRRQIAAWLNEKSPMLKEADETFKFLSPVQEQAQIGQVLMNTLRRPDGRENIPGFLAAMRNQERTLAQANLDGATQLSQKMSPMQMQWLKQSEASAARQADYKALDASTASLPEMRSTFSVLEEATPAFLRAAVAAVRKGLSVKGKITTNEAQQILDRAAADPQFMMKLINSELPKDRSKMANAIVQHIKDTRGLATAQLQNVNQ
jgi:hypothetical protein